MCRREGKPAFFLGTGVNDLAALDTVESGEILSSVDSIWTRDNLSYEFLARHLPDRTKLGPEIRGTVSSIRHVCYSCSSTSLASTE
jgi:hypothetical protein